MEKPGRFHFSVPDLSVYKQMLLRYDYDFKKPDFCRWIASGKVGPVSVLTGHSLLTDMLPGRRSLEMSILRTETGAMMGGGG